MATNYTTKTAALKATTADIRKLTAKEVTTNKLFVSDESGNTEDVLKLIGDVDGAAVKSISVDDKATHISLTPAAIDTNGNVKLTLSETDIASKSDLDALDARVDTAEDDISALETKVGNSSVANQISNAALTASGTSGDKNVTVSLSGTVGDPTISVTTTGLATATALAGVKTTADGAVQSVGKATSTENYVKLTVTDGTDAKIGINDGALKTKITDIDTSITNINNAIGTGTDGTTLAGRLTAVETKATNNATAITNLTSTVTNNKTAADKTQSDLDTLEANVAKLVTGVSSVGKSTDSVDNYDLLTVPTTKGDAKIKINTATLKSTIDAKAAASDLTALTTRVTTAEGEINDLQELVGTTAVATQISNATDALKTGVIKTAQDTADAAKTAATNNATAITNLKKLTLAKTGENTTVATSSTAGPKVKVATTGSIGEGLTGLTVTLTDVASAKTLSDLSTTVNTHISDAAKLGIVVAEATGADNHPNVTSPSTNKIYLVAAGSPESGTYVEWIYVEKSDKTKAWEKIGTTATDLTEYAKSATVKSDIATAKSEAISAAKTYTDERETAITTAYKAYADQAEADAEAAAKTYTDGQIATVTGAATTLSAQVTANTNAIAILNGTDTTTGSVAKALADAKAYTDTAKTAAINAAAADAKSKADAALASAKTYAESEADAAQAAAKTYTDTVKSTLQTAISKATVKGTTGNGLTVTTGTDATTGTIITMSAANGTNKGAVGLSDSTESTSASTAGIAATPKAVSAALAAAKTYADTAEADALAAAKTYADTAEADAIASAKSYTDAEIGKLDVTESTTNGIKWSQTNGVVSISVSADTTPTDNSTKFVTSDGVHAAIEAAKTTAGTDAQTKINNLNKDSHGGYGVTASQSKGIVTLKVAPATSVTGTETVVTDKAVKAYVDGINDTLTAGVKKATLTGTSGNGLTVNVTSNGTTVSMAQASASAFGTVQIASTISTTGTVVPTAATVKDYVDTTVANLDSSVTSTGLTGLTISQENGELTGAAFSVDSKPTASSTKAVTSGAVHAFATKVKKADTTATADVASATDSATGATTYTIDTLSDVTLGTISGATTVKGNKINGANKYVDWSRVTNATSAFSGSTGTLTTFHADLSRLTTGTSMFSSCTKLTSFCGDLGSLTTADGMFAGCNLDLDSVFYIVDSLPAYTSGTHAITIGTSASVDDLITEARNKGWTVTVD